jgi:hypothetical protein
MKGGFGFPSSGTGGSNQNKPSYKADTSKHKTDLIDILKKSERLWN